MPGREPGERRFAGWCQDPDLGLRQLLPGARRKASGPERAFAAMAGNSPSHRCAKPEEMARTILYLASDESSHITSQLVLDRGHVRLIFAAASCKPAAFDDTIARKGRRLEGRSRHSRRSVASAFLCRDVVTNPGSPPSPPSKRFRPVPFSGRKLGFYRGAYRQEETSRDHGCRVAFDAGKVGAGAGRWFGPPHFLLSLAVTTAGRLRPGGRGRPTVCRGWCGNESPGLPQGGQGEGPPRGLDRT